MELALLFIMDKSYLSGFVTAVQIHASSPRAKNVFRKEPLATSRLHLPFTT